MGDMLAFASCFNPLPSPKQGETQQTSDVLDLSRVSIRSPHRSKGRQVPPGVEGQQVVFQSAPLTEARETYRDRKGSLLFEMFQSAPLTEARGDVIL